MIDLLKKSSLAAAAALGMALTFTAPCALGQDTAPPKPAPPGPPPVAPDTDTPAETDEKPKDLPEAKKVLDQMLQALGGKDAIEKIESTHVVANGELPAMVGGGSISIDMYWHADEKIYVKESQTSPQQPAPLEATKGYSDGVGWMRDPTRGYQLLTPEQAEDMRKGANMQMMPTKIADQFRTIETVDQETFAGKDAYKIALSDPKDEENDDSNTSEETGSEETVYLFVNSKTSLPIAIVTEEMTPMGPMKMSATFDKWEEIESVKFFRQVTLDQGPLKLVMNFPTIEINSVDPAVFELPAEVKKLADERKNAEKPDTGTESESEEEGGG